MNGCACVARADTNVIKARNKSFHIQNELGAKHALEKKNFDFEFRTKWSD